MAISRADASSVSIESIVEAALRLLDREGPENFSLRRVGQSMGTYHVMILRRCGGLDGLLDACAEHVAANFPLITGEDDWRIATQLRFEAAYDMWAEHANLLLLMRGRAWLGENMVSRFYEPAMRQLFEAGITVQDAARIFSVLYRTTLGAVITHRANQWTPGESRVAYEKLGLDRLPTLAKVQLELDNADSRTMFRDTLQKMLADLSRTVLPSA
ncbi:MAG TPA: TetR/AcrR family transcriptional regulator C-terminal domain-containing protein [Solirubrobacteraceae bacterium]|nr:TetR/AcrR family transcriptional regulator C-terminal domain-containing protein [Solirubrobacteraceae bacterium]